jgi:hypothetical protein
MAFVNSKPAAKLDRRLSTVRASEHRERQPSEPNKPANKSDDGRKV